MLTHLVLRVLPGPGGDIYGGTKVDASTWANQRLLESSGFIRPLTPDELTEQSAEAPPDKTPLAATPVQPAPIRPLAQGKRR